MLKWLREFWCRRGRHKWMCFIEEELSVCKRCGAEVVMNNWVDDPGAYNFFLPDTVEVYFKRGKIHGKTG